MAAEPGLTEIQTTTLRRRTGKIAVNTMNNHPVLFRMKKAGNVTMGESGEVLIEEIDYQENSSVIRYEDDEELNTTKQPVLTSLQYQPSQAAVSVVMTGLEQLKNAGPQQKINLAKAKLKNAERSIKNMIEGDLKGDGTLDGGRQLGGLALLDAEDPTSGTVGGIPRSSSNVVRNRAYAAIATGGAAASVTNIEGYLRDQLVTPLTLTGETNQLLLLGNTYWGLLCDVFSSRQRFVDQELADLGFQNFKFYGTTCVLGGGFQWAGSSAVTMENTKAQYLNLDYLKLRIYGDRFFSPLSERESINQDASVRYLVFAGQLTCSNFQLQGVLFDS